MALLSSLTRQQKEAVGLLQIGTVLEYFDLMLYVHLAVLLNELFFPQTDPFTASLLSSFAFCSTFVLRPFGALLFGYIGDHISRKATVTLTTGMMAGSCLCMSLLPTYAEIGISAAWGLTLCRAVQGLSSLGEIMGASIYLTEITKPPLRYPVVAWLDVSAASGSMLALATATFILAYGLNWRLAFWIGVSIAVFGSVARTRLRETPDFIEAKLRKKKNVLPEQVNKKTAFALFCIFCAWPSWSYFSYIYCGNLLKNTFGFTPEQVIHQNLWVSIALFLGGIVIAQLSYRIYPIKIVKFTMWVLFPFLFLCPFLLDHLQTPFQLLIIQSIALVFGPGGAPGIAIFYIYFPVSKRVTSISLAFAFARALMFVITSFGLVYLTAWISFWGMWVIMFPTLIAFAWGVRYFEKLDKPNRDMGNPPSLNEEGLPFSQAA